MGQAIARPIIRGIIQILRTQWVLVLCDVLVLQIERTFIQRLDDGVNRGKLFRLFLVETSEFRGVKICQVFSQCTLEPFRSIDSNAPNS